MPTTENSSKPKMNFMEWLTEVIGWLQIVIAPLLLAAIIGCIVYFSHPTTFRLIIGISVTIVGLIVGILYANKIWKKKGTVHFIARASASPELDDLD